MKKIANIFIPVFLCFFVGFLSAQFQQDSIANWYPLLNKPSLTPPNIVFPIAWSILYLLMGLSIGFILNSDTSRKKFFVILFAAQLFLNFTWSIVFFYFQNPLIGLVNIILLDALLIYYAFKAYSAVKISSILFIPYILWVSFASYLNLYIFLYN